MSARAAAVLVGGVLIIGMTGGQAHAEDRLGLSRDGQTWGPSIVGPLFDASVRWVPGDSRTSTFYARNQSTDGAELTVDLAGAAGDPLVSNGDLQVTAQADGGAPLPVDGDGDRRLLEVDRLAQGEAVQVSVTARLRPEATNQTQVDQVRLRFRVTLTEDVPVEGGGGSLPGGGEPAIPEPTLPGVLDPGEPGQGGPDDVATGTDEAAGGASTGPSTSTTVIGAGPGTTTTSTPGGASWLPSTGGPAGWLLLVGGLAVGVGSALVGSRDRDGPTPPDRPRPRPVTWPHHERTAHE
ncbi:MAG: hypothetical protein Q7T56_15965 [Nocardioidaceae bacterium]|nr:hypothetical protein [Nocardioidaceae bacterium]